LRIDFYMQFSMQILQSAWAEPAGWALIVTGLVVATWTLGSNGRRPKPEGPLRRLEPALSEPESHWQRLADILEGDIARAEILPILQARAIAAVEDADEAVGRLLAECAGNLRSAEATTPPQGHDALPLPVPVDRPLAA
jgi:hypothetical protein